MSNLLHQLAAMFALENPPTHVYIVAGLLVFLALLFVAFFFVPGIRQHLTLRRIHQALVLLDGKQTTRLESLFISNRALKHLWDEFKDTLHEQRELNPQTGQFEVVDKRSTQPAQLFFSTQTLVDIPLRTEFFKHLPGILTGLGIIGTFLGLIAGLQAFQISADPETVRKHLNGLVDGVHNAFFVSMGAIVLAMAITFIEKFMIAGLYQRVEMVCQLLDGMFHSGAGEEYLARLVQASEASAKEAKQLKQSLVGDLKKILEEVTERQIAANNLSSTQIADRIVEGMNQGLKEPLADIKDAVRQVSGSQGDAVNKLLTDTMAALTAQLRDLFGQQITGINQMQQQTIETMVTAVDKLEKLISDISSTGEQATASMAEKLASAVEAMDGRQAAMDAQMRALVDEIRDQMTQSHTETNQNLQEAISIISTRLTESLRQIQTLTDRASTRDAARSAVLDQKAADATTTISNEVKAFIEKSSASAQQMSEAVAALGRITTDSIRQMSTGADRLYAASEKFAQAGHATSSTLDRAQRLVQQLSDSSSALTGSTTLLSGAINDYKATRDSLAAMITSLNVSVEAAKKEASLTGDVLSRIERSAAALKAAENEAEKYLLDVSHVLGEAHNTFGTQVTATLDKVNGEFHKHVHRATRALAGAISDLEGVFDKIPAR